MALTVGGSPITPAQLATLQADLGIVVPEEIAGRLTSLEGTDDAIFLRAGVPHLGAASIIAAFTGGGGSGTQTLTPARFNNAQTFYSPTVALGGGGGGVAYIGQSVFTGTGTIVTTIPAGVTATDRVFAILCGADHGADTTGLATYGGPAGWTAEDSATLSTNGTRLLSAPGNVANLTFTATNLRSVTLIGVTGSRRASAMACRYFEGGEGLHTTPSIVAGAGDLVISVYVQQDGSAPTFGTPTTDYSVAFTKVDAAPFIRIATRTSAPAGATGEISPGGGANFSTRSVLSLAIQP